MTRTVSVERTVCVTGTISVTTRVVVTGRTTVCTRCFVTTRSRVTTRSEVTTRAGVCDAARLDNRSLRSGHRDEAFPHDWHGHSPQLHLRAKNRRGLGDSPDDPHSVHDGALNRHRLHEHLAFIGRARRRLDQTLQTRRRKEPCDSDENRCQHRERGLRLE